MLHGRSRWNYYDDNGNLVVYDSKLDMGQIGVIQAQ